MPRNEDGDFELVLGNRQLLSVFFILVVLLGIFFTMGYILGRNAPPGDSMEVATLNRPPDTTPREPIVVEPAKPSEVSKPSAVKSDPVETKPSPSPEPVRQAAQPAPDKPVESKPAPSKPAESKPAPPVKADVKPAPAKPSPVEPPVSAPAPSGQLYLQVAAVGKSEGELYVEVLGKKGFHAIVAPGPSPSIFRVLVGPLKDQAAVARTKSDLEAIGIKPIVRRY